MAFCKNSDQGIIFIRVLQLPSDPWSPAGLDLDTPRLLAADLHPDALHGRRIDEVRWNETNERINVQQRRRNLESGRQTRHDSDDTDVQTAAGGAFVRWQTGISSAQSPYLGRSGPYVRLRVKSDKQSSVVRTVRRTRRSSTSRSLTRVYALTSRRRRNSAVASVAERADFPRWKRLNCVAALDARSLASGPELSAVASLLPTQRKDRATDSEEDSWPACQ